MDVLQPTASITLNALELNITSARLSGGPSGDLLATPGIKIDAPSQTAAFDFGHAIPVGRYKLELEYTGRIATQAAGLFAINYDTAAGRKRAIYTPHDFSLCPIFRRRLPNRFRNHPCCRACWRC